MSEAPNRTPLAIRPQRPAWMHLSLALLFGPVALALTLSPWLSDLAEQFLAAHQVVFNDYRFLRAVSGLLHVASATFAGFLALRYTRLGQWLAINRLVLLLVLPADALVLAHCGALVNEVLFHGSSTLRYWMPTHGGSVMAWLLGGAAGALALSTTWYRLVTHRSAWVGRCRRMLAEL